MSCDFWFMQSILVLYLINIYNYSMMFFLFVLVLSFLNSYNVNKLIFSVYIIEGKAPIKNKKNEKQNEVWAFAKF